jgi:hypothetical protein
LGQPPLLLAILHQQPNIFGSPFNWGKGACFLLLIRSFMPNKGEMFRR